MIKTRNDFPKFFTEMGYGTGAEIGVMRGEFSEHILKNWDGHLILVDCWEQQSEEVYFDIANQPDVIQEQYFHETMAMSARYPNRATVMRMYSIDAAIALAKIDVRLDFIYLDANHSYDETKRDLRAWSPLINSGGMIAGHDYLDAENNCGSRFGVKSAVDEFVEELGLELVIVPDPWPSWYFLLQ